MYDLISEIKDNDIRLLIPYPREKSGIYEHQNPNYLYSHPDTKFPILNLPYTLFDNERFYLPSGYYELALSKDFKKIYVLQSKEIKASFPIIKLKRLEPDLKLVEKESELKKDLIKYKEKNKRKKVLQIEEDLDLIEKEKSLQIYAKIEDTNKDYYIIEYNDGMFFAISYIIK